MRRILKEEIAFRSFCDGVMGNRDGRNQPRATVAPLLDTVWCALCCFAAGASQSLDALTDLFLGTDVRLRSEEEILTAGFLAPDDKVLRQSLFILDVTKGVYNGLFQEVQDLAGPPSLRWDEYHDVTYAMWEECVFAAEDTRINCTDQEILKREVKEIRHAHKWISERSYTTV